MIKMPENNSKQAKRNITKRAMLSRMYKKDLDKIAKHIGIPKNRTKAEMISELVKKLKLDETRKYYSEIFGDDKVDILKHSLVPNHRIISEEERTEIMKKYRISRLKQLPKLRVFDPAVVAVGGSIGDVIEVTRKSSIAGELKYYRLVVR
jgi:DNA-directed RNA polymerase subunit H